MTTTLHDIEKLPLPTPGPISLKGFLAWLEVARPVMQQSFLDQMRKQEREGWQTAHKMGMADYPAFDGIYENDLYKELQARANQREHAKEQQARPTPSPRAEVPERKPGSLDMGIVEAVANRIREKSIARELKPEPALEIVDPEIMVWSPSAEDVAWMERAFKRAKPVAAPVTVVNDLPWLPPAPAKIVALLRRAADPDGRVSVSQKNIVAETGLDLRYVRRLLDRLVESTLLELVREGYGFKKNGRYGFQAGVYQFARTPDLLKAKQVLIRPPGRRKK